MKKTHIDVTALILEMVEELDNANMATAIVMILALNPHALPGGTK